MNKQIGEGGYEEAHCPDSLHGCRGSRRSLRWPGLEFVLVDRNRSLSLAGGLFPLFVNDISCRVVA
jgi:hypothetical protein